MTNPSIASDLTGLISSCRAFALQTQPFGVAGVLNDAAEALSQLTREVDELRGALTEIKRLKPKKIGDTGFVQGPLVLFERAKLIAREALSRSSGGAEDGR